jgi:hypothetical protein
MSSVVVMTTVSSTKHGVGFDVLICFITCVIYHTNYGSDSTTKQPESTAGIQHVVCLTLSILVLLGKYALFHNKVINKKYK